MNLNFGRKLSGQIFVSLGANPTTSEFTTTTLALL
jgi:hypothetical protein